MQLLSEEYRVLNSDTVHVCGPVTTTDTCTDTLHVWVELSAPSQDFEVPLFLYLQMVA